LGYNSLLQSVSQHVGHGITFDGSWAGNSEIEYLWPTEPFSKNEQQRSSAFALIVTNVVSRKVVLICALCMCNGCPNGVVLQSVIRGPCVYLLIKQKCPVMAAYLRYRWTLLCTFIFRLLGYNGP